MAAHGQSGSTRWIMGSVTERVLHQAPCPVLVVRSATMPRHILIPLDGSPLAEKVLPAAFALAKQSGCQVTLLRSVTALADPQLNLAVAIENGKSVGQGWAAVDQAIWHEAEDYLRGQAALHMGQVAHLTTAVRWHNYAAHSILDYAQAHQVDLIAMSTHGRSGVQRWIFGSVTDKVLRAADTCAMFIVQPS